VTGSYPQFMQTSDGRAILGRQPTLTDMLSTVGQGRPGSVGGYGGAPPMGTPAGLGAPGGAGGGTVSTGPITGRGDLALGGGGARGLPLVPGSRPVSSQGVPTGATNLGALLHQYLGTGGGGGGTGGAGGTAPGGISPGASAAESGNRFAQANAAATPSIRNALQMAGLVMSPMTAPQQLLGALLGQMMGFGSGFNIGGPQLSPAQLQAVSQAYQRFGPAYAQAMLATMRDQAVGGQGGGGPGPGLSAGIGVDAAGNAYGSNIGGAGVSHNLAGGLTAAQAAADAARAFAASNYGRPALAGGDMGGGGAGMGGGGPDTGGGLGGGPGNMGGGSNRSV
jgi:hypothetical protein